MYPGPTYIKNCPECSCKLEEPTWLSGNTIGAIHWTDGKTEAPMLPDLPQLVMCPDCDAFLWLANLEVVGDLETMERKIRESLGPLWLADDVETRRRKWHEGNLNRYATKSAAIPAFSDYIEYLSTNDLTPKLERYIRTLAWWAGNDQRRERSVTNAAWQAGNDETRWAPKDQRLPLLDTEISNLECLDRLLDWSKDDDCIMKAEVKRELSEFDEALKLPRRFWKLPAVEVIKELALKRDPFVANVTLREQVHVHGGHISGPQVNRTTMIGWRGTVLWVLGGTVLGFILGGPIGALVVGVLGYSLPLRFFNGKWSHKTPH
jgi:hypothetical protein